jgi:hypothetical protein
MPRCDTEAMSQHLAEIATQIAPGAHAALLVDQAGLASLRPPDRADQHHARPIAGKCPELNPQENVWQFMRDNWLSNRIFKSYDQIVDHCCDAWNKLIDQPWRIMSIGTRDGPTGSNQRVLVLGGISTTRGPLRVSSQMKP